MFEHVGCSLSPSFLFCLYPFLIHHSSNPPFDPLTISSSHHHHHNLISFPPPTHLHPLCTPPLLPHSPTVFLLHLCVSGALSEESDGHTDYEEEAVESALSDMELYNHYGEHTEGDDTADTVRNLCS